MRLDKLSILMTAANAVLLVSLFSQLAPAAAQGAVPMVRAQALESSPRSFA